MIARIRHRLITAGLVLLSVVASQAEIVLEGVGVTASRSPYPGSVAQIIDRYYSAVGGLEAWHSVKALEAVVESTTRLTGSVDRTTNAMAEQIWSADGPYRTLTEVNGMKVLTLFDGDALWSGMNGNKPARNDMVAAFDLSRGNMIFVHQRLENLFPDARIEGETNDTVSVAFRRKADDPEPVEVWVFDKESGLRIRSRTVSKTQGMDPVPLRSTYEDYRSLGPVRIPHRIVFELETSGVTSRTTLNLMDPVLNPEVPEGIFSPEP